VDVLPKAAGVADNAAPEPPPRAAFIVTDISAGLIPCVSHGRADADADAAGLAAAAVVDPAAIALVPAALAGAKEKAGEAPELKPKAGALAPAVAAAKENDAAGEVVDFAKLRALGKAKEGEPVVPKGVEVEEGDAVVPKGLEGAEKSEPVVVAKGDGMRTHST
jgi:hypothetical protein